MTSQISQIKTNEFIRRRKLRLQQVREQSKDIAKKIRLRANLGKLQHLGGVDVQREREFIKSQEKLVRRLELLYSKSLENVGASHKNAADVTLEEKLANQNINKSKLRAKEAATELKRQKQEKLDEQKKLLDRKLQARVAANELSRDKSAVVSNKISSKNQKESENINNQQPNSIPVNKTDDKLQDGGEKESSDPVTRTDMGTQWDNDVPTEWEVNVPELLLPQDDSDNVSPAPTKTDNSKRHNLFALSEEMPSSLRGVEHPPAESVRVRPSLTQVSEYLQTRGLRLREPDTAASKKGEDLQVLKQTIQRSRARKTEGTYKKVCHVLSGQFLEGPSWKSEKNCEFCTHNIDQNYFAHDTKEFTVTNSEINKIFSCIRPSYQEMSPCPVVRGVSPFKRNKACGKICCCKNSGKSSVKTIQQSVPESSSPKKSVVTQYNHSTRDTRDIPRKEAVVVRDLQNDEDDAYSLAVRESEADNQHGEHHTRMQEMRSKVAMTKQSVEKEYKDTMAFLNSLSKQKKSKPIKIAYMDDDRQQMQKENRQRKMQQEYKTIERECKKHNCSKSKPNENVRSKSKSPQDMYKEREFTYSWLPVPESDGELAVHTLPAPRAAPAGTAAPAPATSAAPRAHTATDKKSTNSVKFSESDTYHEYRTRHKHTPPTKERPAKRVETVVIERDTSDASSAASDASSVDELIDDTNQKRSNIESSLRDLSDAERIVIYKILDSKKEKKKTKLLNEIAKYLKSDKEKTGQNVKKINIDQVQSRSNEEFTQIAMDGVEEGLYKATSESGLSFNIKSCYTANLLMWQSTSERKPWWDNITSMYFSRPGEAPSRPPPPAPASSACSCRTNTHAARRVAQNWDAICNPLLMSNPVSCQCAGVTQRFATPAAPAGPAAPAAPSAPAASAAPTAPPVLSGDSAPVSSASFTTAPADRPDSVPDGFIKLLDEGGLEAGKFYVGASGVLNDDGYEVVIQLRKKDDKKTTEAVVKPAVVEQSTSVSDKVAPPEDSQVAADSEVRDILKNTSQAETMPQTQPAPRRVSPNVDTEDKDANDEQILLVKDMESVSSMQKGVELIDRNLRTSFKESYITLVTKTSDTDKVGMSAATQTSFSPATGPVYIHMSSSTSTAYMSPPDIVLPKCYKRNSKCKFSKEDDTEKDADKRSTKTLYRDDSTCRCKRCVHDKNIFMRKRDKECSDPPTSARSCDHHTRRTTTTSSPIPRSCSKCCKCEKNKNLKNKEQSRTRMYYTNRKIMKHTSTNTTKLSSRNSNTSTNLNPIIKEYVNKLLALNKEGLKAINITNQDCSNVTTPASSIVNMSSNMKDTLHNLDQKISLEQIKQIVRQQILRDYSKRNPKTSFNSSDGCYNDSTRNHYPRIPKRKTVHKVKSLNIPKQLLKTKKSSNNMATKTRNAKNEFKQGYFNRVTSTSSTKDNTSGKRSAGASPSRMTSPSITPQTSDNRRKISSLINTFNPDAVGTKHVNASDANGIDYKGKRSIRTEQFSAHSRKIATTATSTSPDSELQNIQNQFKKIEPVNISTQTSRSTDSEINFLKLAEDKIQNMEKIADLTEKCTKRLSNLAKVLEEVRRNRSLAYSQMSTSDGADSDRKSDKNEGLVNLSLSSLPESQHVVKHSRTSPIQTDRTDDSKSKSPSNFGSLSTDIDKHALTKTSEEAATSIESDNVDNSKEVFYTVKTRGKPPPALARINLKHSEDVVPHELSTVLEVDSPMSIRLKSQSSINDQKTAPALDKTKVKQAKNETFHRSLPLKDDPDLLASNIEARLSRKHAKVTSNESSDESKIQMMDLQHFNEIMLKPFISINEYAKQYNIETLEDGSNMEDIAKEEIINDELSSLHSDGSLPDVIAELLKRNIISEPFKFDTASNVNSTSASSESTLSILALSKAQKEKNKSMSGLKNKDVAESSDSLSVSSNPDLENAFKKLGMGWASSTLKKTKERLALSSSSNTSTSSMSQFKMKSYSKDIPAVVTDSVSSALNTSKRSHPRPLNDSKHVEQQTVLSNSMTVKEFLTKELSKKITFNNKSNKNDSQEFVSLQESKMPEEMKVRSNRECSVDSVPSGTNRARTSTPVQVFKSMTYHSTSSSNLSNGLFSNADDLSSVKMTSNSIRNHSTSDKDDLTIPNYSLRLRKGLSDCSKSD